jgi:hypothetical protein
MDDSQLQLHLSKAARFKMSGMIVTPESIPAAELIGRQFQAEPVPSNCYLSCLLFTVSLSDAHYS